MRRTAAALTALTLAIAGLTLSTQTGSAVADAPGAAPATPGAAPRIGFGPCEDVTLRESGAECGTLQVPLDHGRPAGPKIQLAVSRVEHTVPDDQYQGLMLVAPGGPGGSGLALSTLAEFVPKGAGGAYDWIGFDPRGVHDSRPALLCQPGYFAPEKPDYVPLSAQVERQWLAKTQAYAKACDTNNGPLLDHMRTTDTVQDMDAIRAALRQPTVSVFAFSYGTYLAQVYATLYPGRIRRAVLDSNIDPRKIWYGLVPVQDVAFDIVMGHFFAWVADHDDVYHLGTTRRVVEATYYGEQDRLRRSPAGGKVGPAEWNDFFINAGYAQFLWPSTAELFSNWVRDRDPAPLLEIAEATEGRPDNAYASYNAVQCSDAPYPSYAGVRADAFDLHSKRPFLTWNNVWFNAPCMFWPVPAQRPVEVNGTGNRPFLLVDETLDAATPFTGSLEVRRRFPNSRLLSVPGGTTHANTLVGNACVDNRIADYLLTGALPARQAGNRADLECKAFPLPRPGSADALAIRGIRRADLAVLPLRTARAAE